MRWFNNMKISSKILFVVFSVLALTIILGGFSIVQLSRVNGGTVEIATNWLPSEKVLARKDTHTPTGAGLQNPGPDLSAQKQPPPAS